MNTKICNLDMQIGIQQEIFWFQISVHNHVTMAVVNTRDDLLKEAPGFMLLQLLILKSVITRKIV